MFSLSVEFPADRYSIIYQKTNPNYSLGGGTVGIL